MFPPPFRLLPDDKQTPQPLQQTLYRRMIRPFLIVLVLSLIGVCGFPYARVLLYPYLILATVPVPAYAKHIVSAGDLSMTCHTRSILRAYSTDGSFEEVKRFYTTYILGNSAWSLIDQGDSAVPTRPDYWISKRILSGGTAANQSMTLSLHRYQVGMFVNTEVEYQAQQALKEGKTVYFITMAYVDDFKQNRAAMRDPTSECFID